ncbi:MAG: ABC transporter substrate-binding protein [Chloroflexi bacterium]|nr:ABC transporter substrate-binding protein [Chloroflexota bacterium]
MTRHFTLLTLVSMAILAGALSLAACTQPASPTPTGPPAAAAKPYGNLTVGYTYSMNAGTLQSSGNIFAGLGAAMYESLTRTTPEGQTVPNIAERWEISPDGKTHTFYIRKGVKFHDGTDLTGADVKYSMERVIKPSSPVTDGEAAQWRARIESIEIKDDYTVVVRLKQPLFELLPGIEPQGYGGITAVYSKKYLEANGEDYLTTHPMGTGPWKFVKYIPDDRLELEAVEDHWREVPKFKNLTIRLILEGPTNVAMLKTGELDLSTVTPDAAPDVKAAGLRILPHDGASQFTYYMLYPGDQLDQLAIGDVRVRKAMSYAIDRKEMADKLFGGYAEPSAFMWARPTAYFWDSNVLKVDPYDTEQAKKLLAEAGYSNGFTTTIWDKGAGGSQISVLNAAISGYWRKIGVNAELLAGEYSTLSRMISPKLTKEAWNKTYPSISGVSNWQFERMVSSGRTGSSPLLSSINPARDELIDKVLLTKDPAEKKRFALEASRLSKEGYDVVSMVALKTIFVLGARVGEFKPIRGGAGWWGPAYATITHAK